MRFAQSGADVAIAARGREALDKAVKDVQAVAKGKVIGVTGDVAVPADIKRIYDEAMQGVRQGRHRGQQCRHLAQRQVRGHHR